MKTFNFNIPNNRFKAYNMLLFGLGEIFDDFGGPLNQDHLERWLLCNSADGICLSKVGVEEIVNNITCIPVVESTSDILSSATLSPMSAQACCSLSTALMLNADLSSDFPLQCQPSEEEVINESQDSGIDSLLQTPIKNVSFIDNRDNMSHENLTSNVLSHINAQNSLLDTLQATVSQNASVENSLLQLTPEKSNCLPDSSPQNFSIENSLLLTPQNSSCFPETGCSFVTSTPICASLAPCASFNPDISCVNNADLINNDNDSDQTTKTANCRLRPGRLNFNFCIFNC